MSINQLGRGRATGLGSADLSAKQEVKQAKQTAIFQRAGAELVNAHKSLQAASTQRLQVRQTISDRIKLALWSNVGSIAANITLFNVRSPHQSKPHVVLQEDISSNKKAMPDVISQADISSNKKAAPHIISTKDISSNKQAMVNEMVGAITNRLDSFSLIREKRTSDPVSAAIYVKYLKYAALDNPEMSAFLNAMDDLRAAPTVKKAEAMLQDFIVPAEIDDNGLTLEGQSTLQLNLDNDKERNAIITDSKLSIEEAHVDDAPEKLANLVKVFEGVEKYIAKQLARNCKFIIEVNMAFNKIKENDTNVPRFDPTLKV